MPMAIFSKLKAQDSNYGKQKPNNNSIGWRWRIYSLQIYE